MRNLRYAIFSSLTLAALLAWAAFTPVDESIRDRADVRKAMYEYRVIHPACEWCGESNIVLECHHIQPLWMNPELAADTNWMIMLCRPDHLSLGHAGNWGRRAVTNIREICKMKIIVERK